MAWNVMRDEVSVGIEDDLLTSEVAKQSDPLSEVAC